MNTQSEERSLTTADFAAAAEMANAPQIATPKLKDQGTEDSHVGGEGEQLAPLFLPDVAKDFRASWDAVQIGFVDDPRQAVRKADELVAQVMKSLAETFSNERAKLDAQVDPADTASTENLRIALRRYRSFFQRLLAL